MSILSAVQALFGAGSNKRASSHSEPRSADLPEEMEGPQEPFMPAEEPAESAKTLGAALRKKAEKGEISSTPEEIAAEARGFGASVALGWVGNLKTETAEERRTSVNARGEALAAELAKAAAWRAQGQAKQDKQDKNADGLEIGAAKPATRSLAAANEKNRERVPAPPQMSIGPDDNEAIWAAQAAATEALQSNETAGPAPEVERADRPQSPATGEALADELMAVVHSSGAEAKQEPIPTPAAMEPPEQTAAAATKREQEEGWPEGQQSLQDASPMSWQGAGEFEERAGSWGLAYGPIDPMAEDKRKALEARAQEAAIAAREMLGESLLANPGGMPNMETEPVDWATAGPFARDTGALSAAATLRRESGSWSSPKERNPEAIRVLLEESEHASEEREAERQNQAKKDRSATGADAEGAEGRETEAAPSTQKASAQGLGGDQAEDPAQGPQERAAGSAAAGAFMESPADEAQGLAIDDEAFSLSDPEQCDWPGMEPQIAGEGRSGLSADEARALGRRQETLAQMGRRQEAGLAWQGEHEEIEAPDRQEEGLESRERDGASRLEKEPKE